MGEVIVSMKDIVKTFPGVKALDHVNFELRSGEVMALLGENGAGKSTLMKILSGVYEKDEGTIEFDGEIIEHTTPIQALRRGLSIIYQEFNLVNTMTVGENIFLGRFSENHGMKGTHQKARELLDSIGSKIDTYTLVGDLSASEMQMVEITKALSFDSKLIIMDEPSSSLTTEELKKLGEIKESMKEVANGNFDSRIEVTDADDISQLALAFNDMSQRISELMAELVEKERMRSNAELQVLEYKYRALETQIRPHFIYNALEVISSMAKIKGETEMIDIVQTISRYFRNITQSTTDQFITVQQEFDRLQDYTRIYQFMHGDHLKTVFSARETARNAMIPTMILQPVVENSLKYGLRSQEEDSEIRVHAYTQEGKLLITIRDNGKGLTQEQMEKLEKGETAESSSSGIGMANVRQRLKLIYGDKSSISFRNRTASGVKVTIEIPFTYSEPDSLWELEQMDDWSDLDELW